MKLLLTSIIILYLLCITSADQCDGLSSQLEIDNCWMRVVLARGIKDNFRVPFAAMIVNHYTNTIACWGGLNTGPFHEIFNKSASWILHGEVAAIQNCTFLYASGSGNNRFNPGFKSKNHTMYTPGVPCPMCCGSVYFGRLGALVYATDERFLRKYCKLTQYMGSCDDIIDDMRGPDHEDPNPSRPEVRRVLIEESNTAFYNGYLNDRTRCDPEKDPCTF